MKKSLIINYDRELFQFKDLGTIALDWVDENPSKSHIDDSQKPILCIIPGLTSNNNEIYIINLLLEAKKENF